MSAELDWRCCCVRRFGRGPLGVEELAGLAITMSDFQAAIPKVQPSVRREGFTTTPDVTWEDVGSLDEVSEGRLVVVCREGIQGECSRVAGLG